VEIEGCFVDSLKSTAYRREFAEGAEEKVFFSACAAFSAVIFSFK
jgi:hypothetical protein